jgi:hypothetical protein
MSDLFEIWEWDGIETNDALSYIEPRYHTIDQIPLAVENEIRRIHEGVAEETIPYERFDRGGYDMTFGNVIYDLPKGEIPDSFKLMRMTNGILTFGLTAWRKDKHPDDDEGI